jgi:hypothetical protein
VPFLIDTGAPKTFFTRTTIDALRLDAAHHIEILSVWVNLSVSTRHYNDINVLGTDFLGHCNLHVNYPRGVIELEVLNTNDAKPVVWVQQRGRPYPFKVTPTGNDVDALKVAIKAELEANLPRITVNAIEMRIYPPGGGDAAARPSQALVANTADDAPYLFALQMTTATAGSSADDY